MNTTRNARMGAIAVTLIMSTIMAPTAHAAPTAQQICARMIAEGRAGAMSQAQCQCTYRVADATLDDDIKSLLFDAWYTGANNMAALEALPNPNRIDKQMRTMKRTLKKNC